MNELEKLKEEHRRLGERLKALESWPKDGDAYWYIGADGTCNPRSYSINMYSDRWRRAQGNFFKTKEEARKALECNEVIGELLHCEGRVPFKIKTINHCIVFRPETMVIATTDFYYAASGLFNIYFESKEATQAAINKVGKERIILAAEWQATRPVY